MSYSFNVIEQPWIPVMLGDRVVEMNLRDVLHRAHEISAILDSQPIVEFGLYRFLVALVMDIHNFEDPRDLSDYLRRHQSFEVEKIDAYLEKYFDRFDLFHPEHPFLQTPGMENEKAKPVAGLIPSVPSGTAANHFLHIMEDDFGVSPAVAARLLTTVAPFMTAGGAGLSPSINGAPPWYVLVNGSSLFETLVMNCPVLPNSTVTGNTPPAWRNNAPPQSGKRCTQTSLLEALTWRPRQIQLIPSGSGVCSISGKESDVIIKSMKFKAGASCDFTWIDPNVPYRITDKKNQVSFDVLRPQPGKEIWRDTGPLALLDDQSHKSEDVQVAFRRPSVVSQFAEVRATKDRELSISVYGMRTDMKMKVFEWQRERLSVPGPMVESNPFQLRAQEAMNEANDVDYILGRAIKNLYPRQAAANPKAFETIIYNTKREYWARLRSEYDKMLEKMAAALDVCRDERHDILTEWRKTVLDTVTDLFAKVTADFDSDAEAMRRRVEAERYLYRESRKKLHLNEPKQKKPTAAAQGGLDL